MLKKILVTCIFIGFAASGGLFASPEDIEAIISMDMLNPEDINKIESYLSADNVLVFLKVREKLLTYSYEELKKIRSAPDNANLSVKLKGLIDGLIFQMENERAINELESVYVNNIPQSLSSPFYGGLGPDSDIRELNPQAGRVYENNLRLEYTRNDLLKKSGMHWVNPEYAAKERLPGHVQDRSGGGSIDFNNKPLRRWEYRLKFDNLRDFFFKLTDLRQWIKHYEENPIFPVAERNTVILRNEYRIFCVDLKTSNEIWSLGNLDKSCHEFYNTFRHIHENSAGYELLLSDNMLYAELDHKLIGLRLDNIFEPELAWQKDLGEFTLCAKPILNKGFLILALVNPRSEIFICGFSALDGGLKWGTYVGISSFLSPVCSISCVNGSQVTIGTNYGVIISIDSDNGSIIWVRKYLPKQYNLLEYWNGSCAKAYTNDKCPIKFDTEFIQPSGADLYYKPRESDFLYIIDSKTGELKQQLLVDPEKFYILRAFRDKAVFLEKWAGPKKMAKLKVIELSTGKNIYESEIKGEYLFGASYINGEAMLFKHGESIYLLNSAENSTECREIGSHLGGWLVNASENSFFIADNNDLYNYGFKAYRSGDAAGLEYAKEQKDALVAALKEAVILNSADNRKTELKSVILSLLKQKSVSLDKLTPFIISNMDGLKDFFWQDVLTDLDNKYSDEIINYGGVNLRLGGFLRGAGLLKDQGEYKPVDAQKSAGKSKLEYEIYGQSMWPLPVKVIKGADELDFYLIQRLDQVICVDESGVIKWFRKIIRAEQTFLYNDTLIIKDFTNIVGIDARSGKYLWSVSKDLNDLKISNSPNNLNIEFIGADIIIVLDNKAYLLDISTGFIKKSLHLEYDQVKSMHIFKDVIYMLSPGEVIGVYAKDISYKGNISLDFLDNHDQKYDIFFIDGFMIVGAGANAYVIDLEKRKLISNVFMGEKGTFFLETHKNNLLKIVPSKSVSSYSLRNGSLALNWEHNFEKQDGELWGFGLRRSDFRMGNEPYAPKKDNYYFILGDMIFLPYRGVDAYYIAALDLVSGKEEWSARIKGLRGIFDNISNAKGSPAAANFIISTKRNINPVDTYAEYMKDYIADIEPKLISLDLKKGNILRITGLPGDYKYTDYIKPVVVQTKNCYIYGVRGQKIISEVR